MKLNFIKTENIKETILIIIDTNFLMVPIQFHIDIYEELPNLIEGKTFLFVPLEVLDELKNKINRNPEKRKFILEAKNAIELYNMKKNNLRNIISDVSIREILQKNEIEILDLNVDDLLIFFAKSIINKVRDVYIASNDKLLRKKAFNNNIKSVCMHQKKFLAF